MPQPMEDTERVVGVVEALHEADGGEEEASEAEEEVSLADKWRATGRPEG